MKKPAHVVLSTLSKGVPLTISMGLAPHKKYSACMKLRRVPAAIVLISMAISTYPAQAFDPNASRADQVAQIRATYDPQLDAAYANFMKLKAKLASDPSTLKSFNAIVDDFNETRKTINNNLADPTFVMKTVEEYIQEELGEFSTSQFKLTQLAAKIKTITCLKGKVTKKISSLTPTCPKGYTKK